jgi:hypothetical protein
MDKETEKYFKISIKVFRQPESLEPRSKNVYQKTDRFTPIKIASLNNSLSPATLYRT